MQRWILALFFFISGTSGLVFEVIWSRMLAHVFGSTTFALSALLTAFMSGLALGSHLAGKRAASIERPLRLYGLMEAGIGLYGLCVPFLLGLLPDLYAPLFQNLYDNFYLFSLLRFGLVFLALLLPTTFMGATLPLLAAHISRQSHEWESSAGLLYGVNTFGACAGTAVSGFYLLPTLGLENTNHLFAGISLALCATVVSYEALTRRRIQQARQEHQAARQDRAEDLVLALYAQEPERHLSAGALRLVLLAFALAGGLSMTYQVLWTRAYVMVLGSSTYSFSLILATFLVGLASGSALMSSMLRFVRRPVFWLALLQLGVCISAAVCFFTLNKIPEMLFTYLRQEATTVASVYLYNVFLIGIVVLIPTLLQGMTFPLVIRIVSDRAQTSDQALDAGQMVGRAYAINTVGAIAGSFASGFILMPLLGLRYAMGLTLALNLLLGLALGALSLWRDGKLWKTASLATACAAALALFLAAPELNLTRLSSGAFRVYWSRELFTPRSFVRDDPEILFYRDGVAATISVEKRGRLLTLKANGKPEASNDADMATQILVGLLPLVMHESTPSARRAIAAGTYQPPKDVAMVGFGSGVTAGGSLAWPLERLDVVEIEAAMLDASRAFDEVNHRPLEDPRTVVIESDGRNFLEYTADQYDVIVSEPSNPWIAGVASLFTAEHFTRARHKLKPGGVFCQWVQLYELRPENVGRIFKTFRSVFPYVVAFSSMEKGTDLILIGANEPLTFTPQGYPLAFSDPSVTRELGRAGVQSPFDIYALAFLGNDEFTPFIEEIERGIGHEIIINTDDNGILEYEAPRDLIRYKEADQFFSSIYYGEEIYGDMRPWLEDYAQWTPRQLGELAYSNLAKGKQRLAGELATEALRRGPDALASRVLRAWQIYQSGPEPFVLADWPFGDTELARAVEEFTHRENDALALEYLYRNYKQEEDVFEDPEAMLAAAWFFYRARHYKRAHGQLLILSRHSDFLWRAPLVHLLLGFSSSKRRRYQDAATHLMRYDDLVYRGHPAPAPLYDRDPGQSAE